MHYTSREIETRNPTLNLQNWRHLPEWLACSGFFDYAEDAVNNAPSINRSVIEQVRREYYLHIQKALLRQTEFRPPNSPPKAMPSTGLLGYHASCQKPEGSFSAIRRDNVLLWWRPNFLATHDIHPAEFLRIVWANLDDDQGIVEFVKRRSP